MNKAAITLMCCFYVLGMAYYCYRLYTLYTVKRILNI